MKKIVLLFALIGLCSCQKKNKSKKVQELPFRIKFDRMIAELPEYKKYKDESDSLRYFGRRQTVYIKVFEKSSLPEDSLKNMSTALVIRDLYSSKVPLVLVKYDRDLDSIVEVRDLFKKLKDSLAIRKVKTL